MKRIVFLLLAFLAVTGLNAQTPSKHRISADTIELGRPTGSPTTTLKFTSYKAPNGKRIYLYTDQIGVVKADTVTGSGSIDTAYFDGYYNVAVESGTDLFLVPINEITVGTYYSKVGIVDGDSASYFAREQSDGTFHGMVVLEDNAQVSYNNVDGSSSAVQVIDTSVNIAHTRSDGVISALLVTPNMGGLTHTNSNSDITFVGVDSTRATINHQNPGGTEAYGYFNDVSSQVGYKNSALDRKYLLADSAKAALSADSTGKSSYVHVFNSEILLSAKEDEHRLRLATTIGGVPTSYLTYELVNTVLVDTAKVALVYDPPGDNQSSVIVNGLGVRLFNVDGGTSFEVVDGEVIITANSGDIELQATDVQTPQIRTVISTADNNIQHAIDDAVNYALVKQYSLYLNSKGQVFMKP